MRKGSELSSLAAGLSALSAWDSPALSNALERLDVRAKTTDGSLHLVSGTAFCGVAVTARMRAREPGEDGVPVARLWRAVIAAQAPAVVVIEDVDEPPGGGAFLGEVTANLLRALQVAGFVTNGRVRDAADLRALALPALAAGLCVSRSYVRLVEVGVPVTIAGLAISAGDVLHGDEHGMLAIPHTAVDELAAIAAAIRASEQQTVAWARSAQFSHEALLARQPPK